MGRSISMFIVLAIIAIGQNEVDARAPLGIWNGADAQEGEFPYMVQLINSLNGFACGGSVISREWILTAGHCIRTEKLPMIVAGTNQVYDWREESNYYQISIKKRFVHPKQALVNSIPIYDVGLIQLEEPLEFSDKVQPIKLPESEDVPFHVFGNLSGWGTNGSAVYYPTVHLQKLSLRLLTDQECDEKLNGYIPDSFRPAHHLCSDDNQNGLCSGDSGSPFVINGTQYGVVSWTFRPCGTVPGAYSRITNPEYRDWIRNVTGI